MDVFQTAGWLCLKMHAPVSLKPLFNVNPAQQPHQSPLSLIHPGGLGTKRRPTQWHLPLVKNMQRQRSILSDFWYIGPGSISDMACPDFCLLSSLWRGYAVGVVYYKNRVKEGDWWKIGSMSSALKKPTLEK